MKCDRCFFCCHIGKGILCDFPVKYCRYTGKYILPIELVEENGAQIQRELDLRKMSDCKIWAKAGCHIDPAFVKKAERDYILTMMEKESNEAL